ncbi:actin-related protein 2/3 complex subunit 5, partial [Rozella allomycis CSF55]
QDKQLSMLMDILQCAKSQEVLSIIKGLTSSHHDTLMKFIYNGMARPEIYQPPLLLLWHEKIVEHTGLGTIIRVLTDKHSV